MHTSWPLYGRHKQPNRGKLQSTFACAMHQPKPGLDAFLASVEHCMSTAVCIALCAAHINDLHCETAAEKKKCQRIK